MQLGSDLALFAHGHVLRVLVGALARTACGRRTALPARLPRNSAVKVWNGPPPG